MGIRKLEVRLRCFHTLLQLKTLELVLMNGSHYYSYRGQIKHCSQTDLDYMIRQAFMSRSEI